MDMKTFSGVNAARCISPEGFDHPIEVWDLNKWMVAACGELGEAANILKKMNRIEEGIVNKKGETWPELRAAFGKELADTFIYLDLLARRAGFSLEQLVRDKINETSREVGWPYQIDLQANMVRQPEEGE